ncbi:hypothetical protein WJX79_005476 [Trebouxia sp. C0005]
MQGQDLEAILNYGSSEEEGQSLHGDTLCQQPPASLQSSGQLLKKARTGSVLQQAEHTDLCRRQQALPSAAELLSTPHSSLDHLHLQYVPSNSDASHKHQGRKRQFPHVEGNFATHVYITAHSPESVKRALLAELDRQKEAIPKLEVLGRSVKPDDQGIAKPFHLSLSRTVPIKFHQIDPLIASLQAALKQQHSFQLEFCGWRVFMNDEQTRTFLAIPAGLGATEVCASIDSVNRAFRQHQLQLFHEEPSPHISVAWLLGNHHQALSEHISKGKLANIDWTQSVDSIQCCVGQRIFRVWPVET